MTASKAVRVIFTKVPAPPPPPPPPPPIGSQQNPVPIGQSAALGNGWTLTVTQVFPNATDAVLAANEFNTPPPAGAQDFMVAVVATWNGTGTSHLDSGFALRAVGPSGVAYTTFTDPTCGVLPDPDLYLDDPEVFPGATVSGNAACWVVHSSDVNSLVMFTEPFDTDTRVLFALH